MNKSSIYLLLMFMGISGILSAQDIRTQYQLNFDKNWKFSLKGTDAAVAENFNDGTWRTVDLPHDWSIEGSYSDKNASDWQSGYLPAGLGWYRKTFDYNKEWTGKMVSITFEGVYLNSEVWINGKSLGKRPNGYLGFSYDLTNFLLKGKNVITVKVDHTKALSGRWYTGSGIYRHVWLNIDPKIAIDRENTFYSTTVSPGKKSEIQYQVQVNNYTGKSSNLTIRTELLNSVKQAIGTVSSSQTVAAGQAQAIKQQLETVNPELWSPDKPSLYLLQTKILENGVLRDEYSIPIGFRKLEFSGEFGFKLNDVITKIKGVCLHQDAGLFGVAVPDEVWTRRLEQLKEMGVNAIRTSHHPFSPVFYRACDSLGIMVMNEAFDGWEKAKAKDDYGNYFDEWWERDLTAFVKRDRNHPSVIMWSIGNEVPKPSAEIQKNLIDLIHQLDPQGRPVTQGGVDPTRGMSDKKERTQLDIKGFNGDGEEIGTYENFHAEFPDVPMIGTEVPHTYQTRGVYRTQTHWRRRDFPAPWEINSKQAGQLGGLKDKIFPIPDLRTEELFPEEKSLYYFKNDSVLKIPNQNPWAPYLFYQSSYDNASVRSSARKAWQRTMELPYVMGQFRWTGFDYLGETNQWPSRFANFGVIDIAGFPKDHFYLYKSLWTSKPMVHVLPHWTHPGKEGKIVPVVVYTNAEHVELFLNGKSLGRKDYVGEQLQWDVPYTPGTIRAVAYNKAGSEVASHQFKTAGEPAVIAASPDKQQLKANKKDLLFIEITIKDENGVEVPGASPMLNFDISGPAKIKGSDNGDPLDLSDYARSSRRAFRGKCLLVIESEGKPGNILLTISAKGLKPYTLTVRSE